MSEPIEWQDGLGRTWWQPRSQSGAALYGDAHGDVWIRNDPYNVLLIPRRYRSKKRAERIGRSHTLYEKATTFTRVK